LLALALYSSTAKIPFPKICGFLGGPRRREDKGGAPTREFGPILPSGGADMCRFPGLKKFFGKKLPNKILKVHVEKIAKTKGQLKPAKFLTTKKLFEFVVKSHGREISDH
jgi:hypothetical protein